MLVLTDWRWSLKYLYFDGTIYSTRHKTLNSHAFLFFRSIAKWWMWLTIIKNGNQNKIGAFKKRLLSSFVGHFRLFISRLWPFYLHSYTVFRKIPKNNLEKNSTVQFWFAKFTHHSKNVCGKNSPKIPCFCFKCLQRLPEFAHRYSHTWHACGFIPVWIFSWS